MSQYMSSVSAVAVIVLVFCNKVMPETIEDCLKKDSISCLQINIYDHARNFFDRPSIEAFGLSADQVSGGERRGKSLMDHQLEENVTKARDVETRQEAMENFLTERVKNLWHTRAISWNLGKFVDSVLDLMPSDLKMNVTDVVGEARGRRKQLKMLIPLLMALKLKMVAFGALAFVLIAAIAKKAVLASLLSLVVSAYMGIKNLMATHYDNMKNSYNEVTPYSYGMPSAGWYPAPSSAASGPWTVVQDMYPDYQTSGAGQHYVYAHQKPISTTTGRTLL